MAWRQLRDVSTILSSIEHRLTTEGIPSNHVFILKFKLEDCFHDYDPLRTGHVSASDFNKALKEVFKELLTDEEVYEIQNRYCVQNSPDCFNWSKFLHDAETGKILSVLSVINYFMIII